MTFPRRLVAPFAVFAVWEAFACLAAGFWATGATLWLVVFMATVLGLTALTIYLMRSHLFLRQAAPASGPASAETATPPASTPIDVAPVNELIAEAESRLAQSHLKRSLSELPLYLLAGPAGAGKTSTFLASGLLPELLAGQVTRESTVLPTSWCNLWFASGAVFAEAGGRFLSDDPGPWRQLVHRLVSSSAHPLLRKRGPGLRGVIWFCDVTPFLGTPDPTRIDVMARKVQERMQAIGETLGSAFPVYVVFTKADQIPHFGDFVHRLSADDDQQILGCTLPTSSLPAAGDVYADAQSQRLLAPFNKLYVSLAERRLALLAREGDASRRPGVYEFPREVKRLRDSLIHFLVDAFRPNPLQPGPLLRGFYFTAVREVPAAFTAEAGMPEQPAHHRSGGGEATILFQGNLLQQTPSSGAVMTAPPMVQRWVFGKRLFPQVILADPLGGAVMEKNVHRETRQRVWLAMATAAGLALAAACVTSWWQNLTLLSSLETSAAHEFQPGAQSKHDLQALDDLRQQLSTLQHHERAGAPMSMRWGLYSGGRVLSPAYDAYFHRFAQLFLHDVRSRLVTQLAALDAPGAVPYGTAYHALKTYRMITSTQCKPDRAFLVPAFSATWLAGRSVEGETQDLAYRQVRFYAAELEKRNPYSSPEKPELVERGRRYLAGFGGVDRLYRGILDETNKPPRRPARLVELAPNFRDVLASPGEVPAAFTREGWAQVEKAVRDPGRQSLGESCVVGDATAVVAGPEVTNQLLVRYSSAYVEAWKEFTRGTAVQPFRSIGQAARQLEALSDNRSPLLAALFLLSENTAVPPASKIFQPAREVSPAASRERIIEEPNRVYVNALGEMQRAMARLEHDRPANPDAALHEQARRAAESGLDAVRLMTQRFNINEAEGVDIEVKRLLESPFRHSLRYIIADPSRIGRDKAAGAGRGFCAQVSALERKFPFNPQSELDATPEEVAAIFAPPSGALFKLQQQLGRAITRQGKFWLASPDADPRPAPEFIDFLNRLTAISEALFADGHLGMRYILRARPTGGVEAITLEIDGETMAAKQGNNIAKAFTWPGAPGSQQVLVRVKAGANIPFASYEGLWGVFRMMADADPRSPGSRIVELSKVRRGKGKAESVLDAQDKPVQVRLELGDLPNGADVFDRNFFRLRCPARVME